MEELNLKKVEVEIEKDTLVGELNDTKNALKELNEVEE